MEWLWKTQNNWNLIEFGVDQRTSVYNVSLYEIPGLFPLRKIARKKTKVKHITQVCGSMHA